MSKTFCIVPWTNTSIRSDGNLTVCCGNNDTNSNINTTSIEKWWNADPNITAIRETMLRGEEPSGCAVCYNRERVGLSSLRQKTNADYKIIPKYTEKILAHYKLPATLPETIELQVTNLCNLKCLMCKSPNSSAIQTENIKFNRNPDRTKYTFPLESIEKVKEWLLSKPKMLNLMGGEPFIVPQVKSLLKWCVETEICETVEFHLTTNGTTLDDEWIELLSKFKKLRLMISIDAVGSLNDYIRYGSKWDLIASNAKRFSEIPNINFMVHTTLQNLNILYLDELIQWCDENSFAFDYELVDESMFHPGNLPQELLDTCKEKLTHVRDGVFCDIVSMRLPDDEYEKFKEEIKFRDSVRNVSILTVIPELEKYW